MNTTNELAEIIMELFGLSEYGMTLAGIIAVILSGIWVYAKKSMKKAETEATLEHNKSEPVKQVVKSRKDNQTASKEWKDAQADIDTRMKEPGEGTMSQPPEPSEGINDGT